MTSNKTKVWFVTGGSSGLGRAVVTYALEQGNQVIATMRKPSSISDLVAKYSEDQLLVIKLDVCSASDITTVFAQAIEKFDRIDVVYNNAGYAALGEIEGTADDVARAMFEVNFWGSTNVAREAVRVFRDVNTPSGGRLIQASSGNGIQGRPAVGYYGASKHAVEGISEALSKELHPSWNIKITILVLGGFKTRAAESLVTLPAHPAYTSHDCPTAVVRKFLSHQARDLGADPDKAAREIYKIAFDDSVGLRVPLGLDSLKLVENQLDSIRKDVESSRKWSADLK